jgi:hypothetical protein
VVRSTNRERSDKSTREGKPGLSYFITLFVDESDESRKAEEILSQKGLTFSKCVVGRDDRDVNIARLPLLISGQGQCHGIDDIRIYADYLARAVTNGT